MTALLPDAAAPPPVLLYILHSGSLYGTEKMALATAEALTEYHRRIILAPPGTPGGSVLDAASRSAMEAHPFHDRRSLAAQLWRLFQRGQRFDVVTTSITQSLLVVLLGTLRGVRLRHLHAVHGNGAHARNFRWKRVLAPFQLRYVAVSRHVRTVLIACGVPAGKIAIAENFLPMTEGDSPAPMREPYQRRGLRTTGQPVRVVVVGRADKVKRLDLLVEAVATGALGDMQIDVYGHGSDIDLLRQAAAPYPTLRFHGYTADVPARLAEADLFLHTCDVETFGLVVLEAFRAGLVAVVPDAGGTATLVEPGLTGVRYRAGDVADLVSALRQTSTLPAATLDALAQAGHRQLAERFSTARGAQAYRQALESLSSKGRP